MTATAPKLSLQLSTITVVGGNAEHSSFLSLLTPQLQNHAKTCWAAKHSASWLSHEQLIGMSLLFLSLQSGTPDMPHLDLESICNQDNRIRLTWFLSNCTVPRCPAAKQCVHVSSHTSWKPLHTSGIPYPYTITKKLPRWPVVAHGGPGAFWISANRCHCTPACVWDRKPKHLQGGDNSSLKSCQTWWSSCPSQGWK